MNDYTKTGDPIKDSVNASRAALVTTGQNPYSGAGFTPTTAAPISSDILGGVKPINVPPIPTSTSGAGITGATQGIIDQQKINEQLAADQADKQAETGKSKNAVQSLLDQISGKQTDRASAEGDINTPGSPAFLKETARKASNALDISQRAQVNEIRALDDQPLTQGQKAGRVQEINRKYAFEQADLQLTAHLANNDYSAAEDTLNKKLELQLEPLKNQLDFQTSIYNDAKGSLSKADDRQFQNLIENSKQELQTEQTNRAAVGNVILKASQDGVTIPPDILKQASNAKDLTELSSILGNAGIDLQSPIDAEIKRGQLEMQKAQITKLNADAAKALQDLAKPIAGTGQLAMAQAKGNIDLITGLATNKGLAGTVGPNPLARSAPDFNFFTGVRQNFISGVEQLRSQLTLDSLIQAKAKGATFGALSEGELKTLSDSASKLGSAAVKDKNGNVTGYNLTETDFKKELDKINNFAKLDYVVRGGTAADVGAQTLPDGSIWVQNSDGTLTKLK